MWGIQQCMELKNLNFPENKYKILHVNLIQLAVPIIQLIFTTYHHQPCKFQRLKQHSILPSKSAFQ